MRCVRCQWSLRLRPARAHAHGEGVICVVDAPTDERELDDLHQTQVPLIARRPAERPSEAHGVVNSVQELVKEEAIKLRGKSNRGELRGILRLEPPEQRLQVDFHCLSSVWNSERLARDDVQKIRRSRQIDTARILEST